MQLMICPTRKTMRGGKLHQEGVCQGVQTNSLLENPLPRQTAFYFCYYTLNSCEQFLLYLVRLVSY